MKKLIFAFFFTIATIASAGQANLDLNSPKIFSFFQDQIFQLCKEGQPLRDCFVTSKSECETQVKEDFNSCTLAPEYRSLDKDSIQPQMKKVGACLVRRHFAAKKSSLRMTSSCANYALKDKSSLPENPNPDIRQFEQKTAAVAARDSMSAAYVKSVMVDVDKIEEFKTKFKKEPKSFCAAYKGQDNSTCLKTYIPSMKITSSTEMTLYMTVFVGLTLYDNKLGYSKEMLHLLSADNMLTLLENVSLANFKLSTFKPRDKTETVELTMLKADDEKMLLSVREKITGIVEKQIAESEASREPASANQWKNAKVKDLKERLSKFKVAKWTYATN